MARPAVCQPTYGTQCNPVFSEVCRQVTRQVCDADILVEKCGIVDETNCDTVFDTQVSILSLKLIAFYQLCVIVNPVRILYCSVPR